jgi:predicted CXXCH cytochrome family protein
MNRRFRIDPHDVARFALCALAWTSFIASPVSAGYAPGSGIPGSPHDFRNSPYGSGNGDGACTYCHAGHEATILDESAGGPSTVVGSGVRAPKEFDYLPLWNHELTPNFGSFSMYQNGSGAPTIGAKASQATASVPGSASLLCLSCHDGSVAVNAYGNDFQEGGGMMLTGQYAIGQGGVLANHHPVGIDYDAVRAEDNEIRPADVASLGSAGTVRMRLFGPGNTMLECGTCHSVHNSGNTGEYLLWRSNTYSRLCLSCHDKGDDPGAATP